MLKAAGSQGEIIRAYKLNRHLFSNEAVAGIGKSPQRRAAKRTL
jgi:hypothetical protein